MRHWSREDEPTLLRVPLDDIVVDMHAPPALAHFVRARFLTSEAREEAPDFACGVRLEPPPAPSGMATGRRVAFDGEAVWCRGFPGLPALVLRVSPGEPPRVDVWHFLPPGRRLYKRLVGWVKGTSLNEQLTFYGLVYPALLEAERRSRFPLHAAALSRDGRAILLAGLPGVGKSTAAAALVNQGFTLVSDNIVTVGTAGLWSLPEPAKLDADSRRLAGSSMGGKAAGAARGGVPRAAAASYGRAARPLTPPPGPLVPAAVVLLERGLRTHLDELPAVPTPASLLDLNLLAYELHAYYLMRALARLALGAPPADEGETVAAALSGARALRLVVAPDDVGAACRTLEEVL